MTALKRIEGLVSDRFSFVNQDSGLANRVDCVNLRCCLMCRCHGQAGNRRENFVPRFGARSSLQLNDLRKDKSLLALHFPLDPPRRDDLPTPQSVCSFRDGGGGPC